MICLNIWKMLPVMKTIMNHKIQFQLLTRINLSQHMSYVPSPSKCWMCIVTNHSWSLCVPYLSTPQVLEFRSMVHCNQVHAKNLISNCPHLKTYISLKLYGSITLCHILKQILWNMMQYLHTYGCTILSKIQSFFPKLINSF